MSVHRVPFWAVSMALVSAWGVAPALADEASTPPPTTTTTTTVASTTVTPAATDEEGQVGEDGEVANSDVDDGEVEVDEQGPDQPDTPDQPEAADQPDTPDQPDQPDHHG